MKHYLFNRRNNSGDRAPRLRASGEKDFYVLVDFCTELDTGRKLIEYGSSSTILFDVIVYPHKENPFTIFSKSKGETICSVDQST